MSLTIKSTDIGQPAQTTLEHALADQRIALQGLHDAFNRMANDASFLLAPYQVDVIGNAEVASTPKAVPPPVSEAVETARNVAENIRQMTRNVEDFRNRLAGA